MPTKHKLWIPFAAALLLTLGARLAAADEPNAGPSPEQREKMRAYCKEHQDECRAKMQQRAREWFKRVDADGDGTISRQEAEANAPRIAKHFDEIDADHDGTITPEELRAARMKMQEQRRSQGGPQGQGGPPQGQGGPPAQQ